MSAYPASPDPIDWEYYKAKISKSGFVDSFKKQVSLMFKNPANVKCLMIVIIVVHIFSCICASQKVRVVPIIRSLIGNSRLLGILRQSVFGLQFFLCVSLFSIAWLLTALLWVTETPLV